MVTAAERLRLDAQIHLEVREEINVLTSLEGYKCLQTSHRCSHEYQLGASMRIKLALDHLGTHLAHEELIDGLHLECSSVQVAVLPFELGGSWVILSIVFAPCWHPVDVDVLKLVDSCHCVLIEHAKACSHPFEHIVSEDVQLSVLSLVLKHMYTLADIGCEDAPSLFNLDAGYLRHKVLVLLLAKELLQSKVVDSQDVAHSCNQLASTLIESIWDVLTVGTVQELKIAASIGEPVSLDET